MEELRGETEGDEREGEAEERAMRKESRGEAGRIGF